MELYALFKMLAALGVVVALMYGFGIFLKKTGLGTAPIGKNLKERRLKIIENLALDTKRRLAIISCDGKEHLILLGAQSETVVDSDISAIATKDESGKTAKHAKSSSKAQAAVPKGTKKSGSKKA